MNRQRHKLSRRILAMLLAAAMLVTMFPAAMFAAPEPDTVEDPTISSGLVDGHSKSKTATNLDENYQSKVTLSLPSAEEQLVSDVVFVLDKSTSADLEDQAIAMLGDLNNQIKETGAKVKVGVVIFNKKADNVLDLTELNETNMGAIENAIRCEISGGTNSHAGLIAGKAMLDADTSVDANRKYMVFVSDGITYIYNEEPTAINLENGDKTNIFAGPDNWQTKYDTNEAPENWDEWLTEINELIQQDSNEYEAPYGEEYKSFISNDDRKNHAMSIDKALYLTNQVYEEAQIAGYHCYAMKASSNADHPWAKSFMDYLANGETVSFDQIQNDIYYLLDAGSTVKDNMGYVEGDDGYNFDLVIEDDLSSLYMTVETPSEDGTGQSTVTLNANLIEGQENTYGFAPDDSLEAGYKYTLTYTQDEGADEHFVWTTNVPVTNFERVQLHYTVQLTNPKEEAGTYGTFDADGSENCGGLYTNNSAVLTPKDSNGIEGSTEEFAKPTVSYTVKSKGEVLITPADITVYTGGDSYTGVIDDLENGTVDESPEGLPEPGYYLTLPDWINDKLNISSTDEGVSTGANDLSDNITFTYEGTDSSTGEDVTRSWPIELYYADEDGTSYEENISIGGTTRDRYIYQIEPSEPDGNTVRVQFQLLDDNGQIVPDSEPILSDNFQLDLNTLYQQYDMTIYAGYLDQQEVKAQIKDDDGALIATLPVKVDNGTLTVRGTTDGEEIVKVGDAENAAATVAANIQIIDEETESTITAVADNAVGYYINDSMVSVAPEDVHLLADELVVGDDAEEAKAILKDYMVENNIAAEGANFSYQYLDLVDNTNGNAWVTPTDDVDIYWKVPKTANSEDHDFKIVHFNGLNRQYDEPTASLIGTTGYGVEEYTVENSGLDIVEIGNEEYLKFSTDTFSPFILVWEEADDDNPPYIPPTTGDDDDDEEEPDTPALDKDNHFLYIEGYPEDYRTGEYSDNEDLWPVKPQGNITRAEVATIFYRLLKDEVREEIETDVNSFPDVNADDWFNITVSSLANMGAISGYEDGTFRPNEPISRAELASMAVRFYDAFEVEYEEGTFLDVDGDEWYADAIAAAEELGIIGGYPDGTVRPNNNITRAETCAIVNRVLERRPHDEHLGDVDEMRTWPDNLPGAWYYADMQEATNGHYYEWIDIDGVDFEEWTEVDKDYDWTKR